MQPCCRPKASLVPTPPERPKWLHTPCGFLNLERNFLLDVPPACLPVCRPLFVSLPPSFPPSSETITHVRQPTPRVILGFTADGEYLMCCCGPVSIPSRLELRRVRLQWPGLSRPGEVRHWYRCIPSLYPPSPGECSVYTSIRCGMTANVLKSLLVCVCLGSVVFVRQAGRQGRKEGRLALLSRAPT